MRRRFILSLAVAGVIVTAAAVVFGLTRHESSGLHLDTSAVSKLPQHATQVSPLRLAAGLTPPTNRWFSALVFSKAPQPVFAYPLSFRTTATGFELDAPQVTGSSNAIFAVHRPTLKAELGTDASKVTAYDDLSVTLAQTAAGKTVASTKLVQGSPYVFTTLPGGGVIRISTTGQITTLHGDGRLITIGTQTFGVVSSGTIASDGGNLTLTVPAGGKVAIFAVPADANIDAYYAAAHHPVTSTSVSYAQTGSRLTTTYHLATTGGPTLLAANPNLPLDHPTAVAGTFDTLLGRQAVASGNDFTNSQAVVAPPAQLDLSKLSAADRAALVTQLNTDAANITFPAHDTYFSGKELYRAANLLQLAHQLDQPTAAGVIQAKLKTELMTWYDFKGQSSHANKYFYYDSTIKGIVGVTPSFGSEQFNDHHFHYGYFIYASAILAQYDHDFYTQARPMVNLLISDIASPSPTKTFPRLRVFDTYNGHSWASGNGDFADGNNQESTSEAANAWYGIYLWGTVSRDIALTAHGQWLYQLETSTATSLWLRQSGTVSAVAGYSHPFVSLVWGGKLDYSTFFSARPQDLLGIQLIPMSPGQTYLSAGGSNAINRNLASIAPIAADLDGQFGDYLIMYQSLSDPATARANLANFTPVNLDSANSLTYLKAWVYSRSQ